MQHIHIKGKLGPQSIDITIDSSFDGKSSAKFVADFYQGIVSEAPGFMAQIEKQLPTLVKAAKSINTAIEKLTKQ